MLYMRPLHEIARSSRAMTRGRQLKGDEYMKKRTLFTKLTLLCAGLLFFASCSMIDSAENAALKVETAFASGQSSGQKFSFSGSICVTGALPASLCRADGDSVSSRSALPSVGETSLSQMDYYFVTATQTDGSGTFSINSFNNPSDFDTTNGVIFALSLGSGTWQIISGVKRSPTSSSVNASTDPIIMSDTYPATLSAANPVVNHTFYPKPSQSGSGLVGLSMTIPSTVSEVTTTCSNSNWRDNISVNVAGTSVTVMTKNMTSGGSTPSGSYEVTFNFFDEYGILLYSTVQTINVFDNMTTNTWVSDGSGVIGDSGEFSLTADLVSQFARTTFYVGQTAAATSVEVTASDITGSGSPYAPFETVTKAAEVIAATGDSSKDYRIFVSGTVTGAQEISDAVNGKANSITIAGLNGLDSNGEPKDALSCSGSTDAVTLEVFSTVPVTLKNIKLLGDSTPTSKTMVLVLENAYETDVTIEEGVWITGNDTSSFTEETFSAVYVGLDGKLTMNGGKISGNKCMSGGGIVVGGTFVMTGGEISGNEATAFGGGVYNVGIFTFFGGKVSGNTSSSVGSGINNQGTLNMSGDAFVAGGNDIYLAGEENKITLTGALTAHSASDQIAITPSEWKRGTTVVQADGTNLTTLKKDGEYDYTNYFAISDADWETKLSTDNKSLMLDAPIYVAGTGRSVCTDDGDDTNGTGTKSKPYATIAKAVEAIAALNTSADYTIYIDGTVTGAQTIGTSLDDKASSLKIEGVNPLDSDGKPTTILNGNFTSSSLVGTTLTVRTSVSVTISNLKITGGNMLSSGGGIHNSSNSNLTIASGSLVIGNKAGNSGGGICNLGTLTISSGEVSGNEAGSYGGGVYNSGTFTMTSGTISGNRNTNTSTSYGGGGIYTTGTFNMTGGTVKGNSAGNNGGGLYVKGTSSISSSISGGIITENTAATSGGGIYAESGLSLTGGEITLNKSTLGGAVAAYGSGLSMGGSVHIPSGAKDENGILVEGTGMNDLGMASGGDNDTTVTLISPLSLHSDSEPIILTPETYTKDTQALTAAEGVTIANECKKFKVLSDVIENHVVSLETNGFVYILKKEAAGYEVGDIIFDDGTALSYNSDRTSIASSLKLKGVAVIYYKGTACSNDGATTRTLGLGFSVSRADLEWCLESAAAYNIDITTINSNDKDGSDNLEQIADFLGEADDTSDSDKYPAFYYAKNYRKNQTSYNSDWYLPSYAELEPLLTNYNIVLNVFKLFGMNKLDYYYEEFMSSTTCSTSDLSYSNYYNYVLGIGLEEDWFLGKGSCSKKSPSSGDGTSSFSTAAIREF